MAFNPFASFMRPNPAPTPMPMAPTMGTAIRGAFGGMKAPRNPAMGQAMQGIGAALNPGGGSMAGTVGRAVSASRRAPQAGPHPILRMLGQ